MRLYFSLLGLMLNIFAVTVYCLGTLRGNIKPNRVSYYLWFFFPIPGLWAQYVKGFTLETILLMSSILAPVAVLFCSYISKSGYWKITKLDINIGIFSLVVFIISLALSNPLLAMIATIASNFLASVPTIRKSYIDPFTENPFTYLIMAISGVLSIMSSNRISIISTGFSFYIVFIGLLISSVSYFRQKMFKNKSANL